MLCRFHFSLLLVGGMSLSLYADKITIDLSQREHFNKVMVAHLKGIGYAEATKTIDTTKGLAAWWQDIAVAGGFDSLIHDEEVLTLAKEMYEAAVASDMFKKALQKVDAGTTSSDQARFHMQAVYVLKLVEFMHERGCFLRRPDSAPKLSDLKPGQGGTFVATEAINFGRTAYIADLVETNAEIDIVKHKTLLAAMTVAQMLFRTAFE